MNLITDDWRLKLLAVGLALLMLGAVAFFQNPPTTRTLTVGLNYTVPPGLILIKPPSKTAVTISGLADIIGPMTSDNLVAVVDATHASPGPDVKLAVTAKSFIGQVTVQNPPPIAVNIDVRQTKDLPVQVFAHGASGWRVTKAVALCPGTTTSGPCVAQFDGPASWEVNLVAAVVVAGPINVGTTDALNQALQLQNSMGVLDQSCRTVPCASLDPTAASIHIEAVSGSTSSTIPLVQGPPTHGPATGYQVTAVTISPITVIISGDPAILGRIQRILLPPVDLSGRTSDATFQIAIPYPPGVDATADTATVIYKISANPNVTT